MGKEDELLQELDGLLSDWNEQTGELAEQAGKKIRESGLPEDRQRILERRVREFMKYSLLGCDVLIGNTDVGP